MIGQRGPSGAANAVAVYRSAPGRLSVGAIRRADSRSRGLGGCGPPPLRRWPRDGGSAAPAAPPPRCRRGRRRSRAGETLAHRPSVASVTRFRAPAQQLRQPLRPVRPGREAVDAMQEPVRGAGAAAAQRREAPPPRRRPAQRSGRTQRSVPDVHSAAAARAPTARRRAPAQPRRARGRTGEAASRSNQLRIGVDGGTEGQEHHTAEDEQARHVERLRLFITRDDPDPTRSA
ncbi:MAG: hypothetical protein QOF73_2 [Thermomicrobiales bacterium]|nr:hypothetical protein [Thermomicrobiales bacterium]